MTAQVTAIDDYRAHRTLFDRPALAPVTAQPGSPAGINDSLMASRDLYPMDTTPDRLAAARGVILCLGLGACAWAVIGALVFWLA